MSSILFKRLFEVQFLHDYFLMDTDGASYFGKNKEEKTNILVTKLSNNLYDIRDLFEIIPLESTRRYLSEYKLVTAVTAMGLIVGVEVVQETQAGETVYRPRIEIEEEVNLRFAIRSRHPLINGMTNLSLSPPLPAKYYFTNKDKEELDEGTVPNHTSLPLSNKSMTHQNGMQHEMGAIIDFAGTVREAIQLTDGSDATHWEDIDDKRYVTNADRILLPHNFSYSLDKDDNILQVDFILEDLGGTEIKAITQTSADPLTQVALNFSKVDETDEESDDIPAGQYILKVTAGANPEITYSVYLDDSMYESEYLGVIDIRADELASPFSLVDAGGFLKTRIDAADNKVPHPVFEIRFKNRRTYWRYNKEVDFTPAEIAATAAHLQHQPEMLISLKPKALTQTLVPFINGVSLVLPHPKRPAIKVEGDRIFSEIYINQSNRLLNS